MRAALAPGVLFVQSFRHAVLWRDGGIIDLQTVNGGPCSDAYVLNSSDQVVGTSGACDESSGDAFLWENGSIVDLNTLIPSNAGIELQFANWINESGEIAGVGVLTDTGDYRGFLLIPCDENHPGIAGCNYDPVDATIPAQLHPTQPIQAGASVANASESPVTEATITARSRFANRHRWIGTLPLK